MMGSYLGRNKSPAEHVKQHVKYELSTLLCHTIVNDSSRVTTACPGSERRLISLQKQMGLARNLSTEWSNILYRVNNIDKPWHVTLHLIVEETVKHQPGYFKLGHLIVLCAYMSDTCNMNLSRNKSVDICVVVETLVDVLVERRFETCVQFLNYLDA